MAGLAEGLEQPGLLGLIDADTGIQNGELHGTPAIADPGGQRHRDRSAIGVLDGVADQVGDDLLVTKTIDLHPGRIARDELQPQVFLPRQRSEYGDDRRCQGHDVMGFGGKFEPARLDLGNIQDVADEAQQIAGRAMGNGEGGLILLVQPTPLERQFQQADDGIHGGTDLVAHGREEGALGTVCLLGLLAGHRQLIEQAYPFADVDPASHPPLHIAVQIVVRLNPVIDVDPARRQDQTVIPLLGAAAVTGKHQIPVQGSKKRPARSRVVQARAEQTDLGLAKEAGIAAVAQYQDPVQIPRIDGVRCPVHQIGDELELGAQRPLHQSPLADLLAQGQPPQANPEGQQQDQGDKDPELLNQLLPGDTLLFDIDPPAVGEPFQLIRRNDGNHLVQNVPQYGMRGGDRKRGTDGDGIEQLSRDEQAVGEFAVHVVLGHPQRQYGHIAHFRRHTTHGVFNRIELPRRQLAVFRLDGLGRDKASDHGHGAGLEQRCRGDLPVAQPHHIGEGIEDKGPAEQIAVPALGRRAQHPRIHLAAIQQLGHLLRRLGRHHLELHPQLGSHDLQQIGDHAVHGTGDVIETEGRDAAVHRNPDLLPFAQPFPLLAAQVDSAGTDGEAPPIPALGHFRPLALEDLPQRDIHDPLESPLLGIEGKGKTGGIDIERLQ